jgi:hypothetical protein
MSRNSLWENSDGLAVGFGTHTSDNDVPAVIGGSGAVKTAQVELSDATALEVVGSLTVSSFPPQGIVIPRGSRILEATFQVKTAFTTGASGALNIGTNSGRVDGAYTADDENGIDVAIAVTALDAIGAVVACDGALVAGVTSCGATSTTDVNLCFGYTTGVFTAGAGILTVRYIEPSGALGESFAAVE